MRKALLEGLNLQRDDNGEYVPPPVKPHEVSTDFGVLKAHLTSERRLDSEYVVSFISSGSNGASTDRSCWFQLVEQSDDMLEAFDLRMNALAQLAAELLSKRTSDRFGRGIPEVLMVVQKLAGGTEATMTYRYHVGGVAELVKA